MKLIIVTAAVVLAASSVPAVPSAGPPAQSSVTETQDRLPPERMEQLVAGPMSVFRKSGLVAARKDFDTLLAGAVKAHGKGSVEAADLLTSFAVQLFEAGIDDDTAVAKASLDYLKRAISAYRAAFGPRHPEVALALNSYADALMQVNGDAGRPDAKAALEEAHSIRVATLGADNPETQAAADKLAQLNDSSRSFTAERDAANAIASAAEALGTANSPGTVTENLTGADMGESGLWKPIAYYDPLVDDFIDDANKLDKADAGSRAAIASKYHLTPSALDATVAFARKMDKNGYDRAWKAQLAKDALQLVQLSNRAPIALMFAGAALDQLSDSNCTKQDLAKLMSGSSDPDHDLWSIISTCSSSAILADAIGRRPAALPALLYVGLRWTNADPAMQLASADMLLRPEFLALIGEQQREQIYADIAAYKLNKLLALGLLPQALAFGDSLPPHVRSLALSGTGGEIRASIAGFRVKTGQSSSPAIQYAAALALAHRDAEARSVLDTIAPASKLRSVRACLDGAGEDCGVGLPEQGRTPLSALVVEQLLDAPTADPYVLMESAATGWDLDGGAITEALCRMLSQPDERNECEDRRNSDAQDRAPDNYDDDDDRLLWAAVDRADGQPFDVARARYRSELDAIGSGKPPSREWTRPTIDPAPVPFHELPLSQAMLTRRPLPSLGRKAFAPLPQGYTLVRAERSGKRVAAISLSQRFDPDGEVTAGGYWLHLSDDGGKTWQPPLYTGLAEHFPYVVPSSSRLPMIWGDRIRLEVQESLIDTASITYPPVETRLRRKRSGIYLDIPIAELRKDSDGDGITDIAARHLLLDGKVSVSGPFIVGTDGNCSKRPSMESLARLEILKKLFQVQARALIEPVGAAEPHFGDWRRAEATSKTPIFLEGNPDDYRCLSIDRLMVVYPEADQDQLRKFSPDFQLVELPPLRWNRDQSRAFVRWSTGWAGGTYRLVRDGGGWKIDSIGEWIT